MFYPEVAFWDFQVGIDFFPIVLNKLADLDIRLSLFHKTSAFSAESLQ
jgi:hypothetical protein